MPSNNYGEAKYWDKRYLESKDKTYDWLLEWD